LSQAGVGPKRLPLDSAIATISARVLFIVVS
jgi:hypothetical protein